MYAYAHRLIDLLAGSVLGLAVSFNSFAEIDSAMVARLSKSLVKVQGWTTLGDIGIGTGVVVATGKVITNCHVIKNAERIQLMQDGIRWDVTAIAPDVHHDLCLLMATRLNLPAIKIGAAGKLKVGDEVVAGGFALGSNARFSRGNIYGLYAFDNSSVIRTSAQFAPGDSGGALIDREGNLVGINCFFSSGASSFFAVPVEWFVARIANTQVYKPVSPIIGMPFWYRSTLAELPMFLQAANFEALSQWVALLALTENWLHNEPHNPDAWTARGNALRQIGDINGATEAHNQASTIYAILILSADQRHSRPGFKSINFSLRSE